MPLLVPVALIWELPAQAPAAALLSAPGRLPLRSLDSDWELPAACPALHPSAANSRRPLLRGEVTQHEVTENLAGSLFPGRLQ